LPSSVRGPVDLAALARLAASCNSDTGIFVAPYEWGDFSSLQ